ncbi:hypothetical protein HPK01_11025 [Anoxybacillus flavithermus]|uniref:hypothetical protein n=1 Tax=Anoxybacillus flavithermus TaxID=33934 RepID=UPI0018663A60|nr:hypothetical protein [Anoxybacillus flavithermus]MBE2908639.1 hypothetical protein [Anoxybacillus flavithermus]
MDVMWILFRRNPLFWVLLVCFLAYVYYGFHFYSTGYNFSPGEALVRMSFAVQGGMLAFLFFGVLFIRLEENNHLHDIFSSIPKGNSYKFMGKFLFFSVFTLFVCLFVFSIYAFLFFRKGISFLSFYYDAFLYIVLYWGLSFLLSMLIGALLASWFKGKIIYPLILFVWALIGPANSYFFGTAASKSLFSDFLAWINLGEPNPLALFNDLYGFELSVYHWMKKLFMLLLISFLFLFTHFIRKRGNIEKRFYMYFALCSVSIGALIYYFTLDRQIYISNSLLTETRERVDETYYHTLSHEYSEPHPDIAITKYDVNMKIKRLVEINTTVTLVNNYKQPLNNVSLSLYHGFKVIDVSSNHKKLSFEQKNDLLNIQLPSELRPKQSCQISISYEGLSSPLFFANSRAVYLPYYFPWLPSNNIEPAFQYTRLGLIRNNHQWGNDAEIALTYDGPNPLYTNIKKIGNKKWHGRSSFGLSVVVGNIAEMNRKNGGAQFVQPMTWGKNLYQYPEFKERTNEMMKNISNNFNIEYKGFPELIIFVPILSISDFVAEEYIWFASDHLIYGTGLQYNATILPYNESYYTYMLVPALTWKYKGIQIDDIEYLNLFDSVYAYVYNQQHGIEDDGGFLPDVYYMKSEKDKIKNSIIQWVKNEENIETKNNFCREWFKLIENGRQDWNTLKELTKQYFYDKEVRDGYTRN